MRVCLDFAQNRDEKASIACSAAALCWLDDLDEVQRGERPRPGAHRAVASPAAKNIHTPGHGRKPLLIDHAELSSLSGSPVTFEPDYGVLSDALEP